MREPAVLVSCGVGGAGKTTVAAAFAVAAAAAGQRTAVLTIDPARRLADALGAGPLGNLPRPVDLGALGAAGGSLHALMLDRKATFDEMVTRFAGDPKVAERLLANRYYRAVSTRLTGSHEYMAIEKLYQLVESGNYDTIVLDTPPVQHAVEFFEAPERIERLFEPGVFSAITSPGRGILGLATRRIASLVERLAGETVIHEFTEFFQLVSALSDALRARNRAVHALLRSPKTKFHLVTTTAHGADADARRFRELIAGYGLVLAGLVVNRVTLPPRLSAPIRREDLPRPPGISEADWELLAAALLAVPGRVESEARRHAAAISRLSAAADAPVATLPDMPGGIRDLTDLAALAPYLPRV